MDWIVSAARWLLRKLMAALGDLTPESSAEWVAGKIRSMPPEQLDRLMRSPARRIVLEAIFWEMPRHVDRSRAAAVNASIRWKITGGSDGAEDIFDIVLADGDARVKRGGGKDAPRLTITLDGAEFLRLAVGSSNPVSAYLGGKLSMRGDVMQAARLTMLFRIPTATKPQTPPKPRTGDTRQPPAA